MQKQTEFPLPLDISLVPIEESDAVRWSREIRFVIDDPHFGKLTCVYEPKLAVGALGGNFSKRLDQVETLHCVKHAFGLIHEKIAENLRDALEGMVREIIFQTYRDLNGHAFFGNFKSTEWMASIRKWHASASGKRIGTRRGPQKDAMAFVRNVIRAASKIEGPITQLKLATALRYKDGDPRGLQQLMDDYGYTWSAIEDMCRKVKMKEGT